MKLKHGPFIVCATTACLRARLRTLRSRDRQGAGARLLVTFGLYLILLPILSAAAADVPSVNADLMHRAGKTVEKFWDQLQAVNCVETVDQQKLNPNGKLIF